MAAFFNVSFTPLDFTLGDMILVEATRGGSAGRAQPRPSAWKALGMFDATDNPFSIESAYTTAFGRPRKNSTIHVRITAITADGQRSNPCEGICVVA